MNQTEQAQKQQQLTQKQIEKAKKDELVRTVESQELTARKWKADFHTMYYSLETEKLQSKYEDFLRRNYPHMFSNPAAAENPAQGHSEMPPQGTYEIKGDDNGQPEAPAPDSPDVEEPPVTN